MILISRNVTTPLKGRPLLQAIVFLTPMRLHLSSFPAAVDAQMPCRQASGSSVRPSCSSVTSLITGRHVERVLPSVPRFVRHHAGNTYTVSFFVFALQQRWNRISLIFFVSWLPVLAVIPSDISQFFLFFFYRPDRLRNIFSHPRDSIQSLLLCSHV